MNSSSFSASAFKHCASQFATGIAVITTSHAGTPKGITVNSFTSVSLDPPLVSFNLIRAGTKHRIFSAAEFFAVHILSHTQESLSRLFSGSASHAWDSVAFALSGLGNPILSHTIAHMECRHYATHEAGDHSIVLGEVLTLSSNSDHAPLLYFRSRYTTLSKSL